MGAPNTVTLGWEDLGPHSNIHIFGDSANPYDSGRLSTSGRGRLYAMRQMGMEARRCESCGSHSQIQGVKIAADGPESPENYIALCPQCTTNWCNRS